MQRAYGVPDKCTFLTYLAIHIQVGTSNTLAPLPKAGHSKYLSLGINWTDSRTVVTKSGQWKCLIRIVAGIANGLITIPKATATIVCLLRWSFT